MSGMSTIKHLENFHKILAGLLNLDIENFKEDKSLLLLNSLPDMYDHLTTTYCMEKVRLSIIICPMSY